MWFKAGAIKGFREFHQLPLVPPGPISRAISTTGMGLRFELNVCNLPESLGRNKQYLQSQNCGYHE